MIKQNKNKHIIYSRIIKEIERIKLINEKEDLRNQDYVLHKVRSKAYIPYLLKKGIFI